MLCASLALLLGACAAPRAAPATPTGAESPPPTASPSGRPAAAPAAAREAIRIPYSAISLSSLPHWVAYDAGYYAEEGLDVTLEYISSSTTLAPALLSGEIPVAYAGQEVVITSGVRGGDLVIIGAGLERPLFWLSVQGPERTPEELRGKRFGVTRFGSSSDVVLRAWLATVGLSPDRDVTILQLGGTPEMVGALQAGGLDVAVLSPPAVFQAQRNGATPIVDLGELDLPFYQNALITTRRFLAERPDTARRVARAFARAWPLLQDEAAALASLRRHATSLDDELLVATYRAGVRRFAPSPVPRVEPVRRALEQLAAREPLPPGITPEQFVVPELIAAALAS